MKHSNRKKKLPAKPNQLHSARPNQYIWWGPPFRIPWNIINIHQFWESLIFTSMPPAGVVLWIFPCWFQPSSLVTCPTLYTYLMPLWLRGPSSHFVAEIIRSGAMENSAWALRLLTGECSICSYQYNSLPSELPLLHGSGAGTLKGPASVRYLQVPTVGTICVPSSSEDFQSWGHWSQPERHLSQCEAWRLTRRTPSEIYNSMGSHQVIVTSGERWFWV